MTGFYTCCHVIRVAALLTQTPGSISQAWWSGIAKAGILARYFGWYIKIISPVQLRCRAEPKDIKGLYLGIQSVRNSHLVTWTDGTILALQTELLLGFFAWVPLCGGLQCGLLIILETLVNFFFFLSRVKIILVGGQGYRLDFCWVVRRTVSNQSLQDSYFRT